MGEEGTAKCTRPEVRVRLEERLGQKANVAERTGHRHEETKSRAARQRCEHAGPYGP